MKRIVEYTKKFRSIKRLWTTISRVYRLVKESAVYGVLVFLTFVWLSVGTALGVNFPSVTPAPPPGIDKALLKVFSWLLWAFVLAGGGSIVYGVFKAYTGDKKTGLLLFVGGIVLVIVAWNLSNILRGL